MKSNSYSSHSGKMPLLRRQSPGEIHTRRLDFKPIILTNVPAGPGPGLGEFVLQQSPHQGQRMVRAGAPAHRAKAAMILVHGRGASAESMLSLADVLAQP